MLKNSQRLTEINEFLFKLDELKSVNRKTYINGGKRVENSAEHSWHLAMACWAFAEMFNKQDGQDYDIGKIIQLALVHDLGEMEAGDTFLYSENRSNAHIAERESIENLANHKGNNISNLLSLWDEQEFGTSKETKLLKVVDRLLPFLHNMTSEGQAWKDMNIHKDQVLKMHAFIEHENLEVYAWFINSINYAVEQGWLRTD
ncbi:HD domain-containing protein [Psychrobacter sp. HD31]|uniref:HD domain-containing protein n=1 Tax=Psychrobacter sp. HD31 TaxID=3112003 RepID=UPI003DA53E60